MSKTLIFFFLIAFLISTACTEKLDIVSAADFSKAERTNLGEILGESLRTDANTEILSPSEYGELYAYLQQLYNQATIRYRIDGASMPDDRWDQDRIWQVHLLKNDEIEHAFALPGGDIYLTTGLLLNLDSEAALYYILQFEATLVQRRELLSHLTQQFSGQQLRDFGQGTSATLTAEQILGYLYTEPIDAVRIPALDQATAEQICVSSLFAPSAISSYLEQNNNNRKWLEMRPTYTGRMQQIETTVATSDCGEVVELAYAERVLKWF